MYIEFLFGEIKRYYFHPLTCEHDYVILFLYSLSFTVYKHIRFVHLE